MSVAPCFADTNDLALDQPRQLKTPSTRCNQYFLILAQSLARCQSHHLSYCLRISSSSVTKGVISPPNHFLYLLSFHLSHSSTLSLSSYWLSIAIYFTLSPFFFPSTHLFPLPFSLSLSAQPTASLSLGRGEQCRPTWAPVQSQPRRQGAPENTHNSVFQLGFGIKGSLTHG